MSLKKKLTNTQISAAGHCKEDNGQNNFKEDKKRMMKEKDNVKSN